MSTVAPPRTYSPQDLLKMPDGDRFELVDGHLVEHTMSAWSSYVGGVVYQMMDSHARAKQLGWVLPEGTTFQCFPDDPNKVRRADVSFFSLERLSVEQAMSEGHLRIAPDLAVEVVSPNDLLYKVHEKIQDFLKAEVKLVWVVDPQARFVEVHRPRGAGTILREHDFLEGEDVLPGFRCRVGDLFLPPVGAKVSS
jgi:Uma2 family endonuclease